MDFSGYSSPHNVIMCFQGGRRGLEDTEPAFEAVEMLRRQLPSTLCAAYTPEFLEVVDESLPGEAINVYEVQLSKNILTVITVNTFSSSAYELCAHLAEQIKSFCAECYVISSSPSAESMNPAQRWVQAHNGLLEINQYVYEFTYAGILRQFGIDNVAQLWVPWPTEFAYAGCDAVAAASLLEELAVLMGVHTEILDSQHPLMRAMTMSQDRYLSEV